MKKLFVLFALIATTSLFCASDLKSIPPGAHTFNFGYFAGYASVSPYNAYNRNVFITASQAGTFTYSGYFSNYIATSHSFSNQSYGNWSIYFDKVDFFYNGYLFYTSYSPDDSYSFLANVSYSITYTIEDNR
jgi:hypothetical protein